MDSISMDYYVYAYLDQSRPSLLYSRKWPFRFLPFYVGKGKGDRDVKHLTNVRTKTTDGQWKRTTRFYNYLREMLDKGMKPIIVRLVDGIDNDSALLFETHFIRMWGTERDKGLLQNMVTDTVGTGIAGLYSGPYGDEIKRKISRTMIERGSSRGEKNYNWHRTGPLNALYGRGRNWDITRLREHSQRVKDGIARSGRNYKGENHPSWGKKRSEEARQRMSKPKTKTFKVISPNGEEFILTKQLKQFCAEHDLNYITMLKIAQGKFIQNKGWKCEKVE